MKKILQFLFISLILTIPSYSNAEVRDEDGDLDEEVLLANQANFDQNLCGWSLEDELDPEYPEECMTYALTYDFDDIEDLPSNAYPEIPQAFCYKDLKESSTVKKTLVRLMEQTQVSCLLYYASLDAEKTQAKHALLELALIYEMYLRDGNSNSPNWWQFITVEDQNWLNEARPRILKNWQNRPIPQRKINIANDPNCVPNMKGKEQVIPTPITKSLKTPGANGRQCSFELGKTDFLGITGMPKGIGPFVPIQICSENEKNIDVTGENVAGLLQSQMVTSQLYIQYSVKSPKERIGNRGLLIMLLVLEMYLRDGKSDNPIWWNLLTKEDQKWLKKARPQIYERWKNRLQYFPYKSYKLLD